ncbi:hypothetical protein [Thiocapsa bogorovii]|uniref:hypothetical protein n=1 Tax=Thiocapsa bogorovii TaxID=521689 RepID=UPI001E3D59F3|nr:hypothetical protein [Thiocapsa bogorovii]UHD17599.1 hypothetical protein LT988_05995 [Thiocapsa bogorovii]
MKADAEAAKAKLLQLAEAKKAELEERVAEWTAKHDKQKLEKRAERAEAYAVTSVEIALAAAMEAEEAILEAAATRMDADQGLQALEPAGLSAGKGETSVETGATP